MANFDLIQQQFLMVVDNQLKMDNPKETRQTLERLKGMDYSDLEAKSLIAQCVAAEMYEVMKSNRPFNEQRYVGMLNQLPTSPLIDEQE